MKQSPNPSSSTASLDRISSAGAYCSRIGFECGQGKRSWENVFSAQQSVCRSEAFDLGNVSRLPALAALYMVI